MAIARTPPLEERIANIREECIAVIDVWVEEEKKRCPGVPAPMLRACMAHGIADPIAAYLEIKRQRDDEANAQKGTA